jgi:hypothetical protein
LIQIIESSESIVFMGQFEVSGENRLYYRTTGVPGDKPKGYTVIYVVA